MPPPPALKGSQIGATSSKRGCAVLRAFQKQRGAEARSLGPSLGEAPKRWVEVHQGVSCSVQQSGERQHLENPVLTPVFSILPYFPLFGSLLIVALIWGTERRRCLTRVWTRLQPVASFPVRGRFFGHFGARTWPGGATNAGGFFSWQGYSVCAAVQATEVLTVACAQLEESSDHLTVSGWQTFKLQGVHGGEIGRVWWWVGMLSLGRQAVLRPLEPRLGRLRSEDEPHSLSLIERSRR